MNNITRAERVARSTALDELRAHLKANPTQRMTLEEIAAFAGVSESYARRMMQVLYHEGVVLRVWMYCPVVAETRRGGTA